MSRAQLSAWVLTLAGGVACRSNSLEDWDHSESSAGRNATSPTAGNTAMGGGRSDAQRSFVSGGAESNSTPAAATLGGAGGATNSAGATSGGVAAALSYAGAPGTTKQAQGGSVVGGASSAGSPSTSAGASAGTGVRQPDELRGIFVDGAHGTDSPNCRSIVKPCKTVQAGLSRANDTNPIVYVASGTYQESIVLPPNVRVEGGWDVKGNTWLPVSGANPAAAVVIQAPEGNYITAVAENAGETVLSLLTIRSAPTPPKVRSQPGKSLYGIFATGENTQVTLLDVDVVVENAGHGGDVDPGAKGALGDSTCDSGDGKPLEDPPPEPGGTAPKGTFDKSGYHPQDGQPGQIGSQGHNGIAASETDPPSLEKCARDCSHCRSETVVGARGTPGCGGKPGSGGPGGKGGGGSFAVYAWGAHVSIMRGTLTVGNGGNGSPGGEGGEGGDPSQPTQGALVSCMQCKDETTDPDGMGANLPITRCIGIVAARTITGTTGGPGSKGGSGSRGGYGRGGPSCSIFHGGDATIDVADQCRGNCFYGWPGNHQGEDATGISDRICTPQS